MQPHQAGVELISKVSGRAMGDIVQCLRYDPIRSYLEKHGIATDGLARGESLATWLSMFGDLISQKGNALLDLVSVGQLAVEADPTLTRLLERALSTEQSGLASYSRPHARSNGNGKNWAVDVVEDGHVQITTATPYPDDLLFGVFYGMARRFLPANTPFTVLFDNAVPTRDRGGEVTIIHIVWE
jgi:hypothetical protein